MHFAPNWLGHCFHLLKDTPPPKLFCPAGHAVHCFLAWSKYWPALLAQGRSHGTFLREGGRETPPLQTAGGFQK